MSAVANVTVRHRRSHRFHLAMAAAIVATVVIGFAPSYYLRSYYGTKPLSLLLHVHGLVFSSWILLYVVQTTLVAARRTDIHRRLGVAGAVLSALVIFVGSTTAVIRAGQGAAPIGIPPLGFLIVPLFDMVTFALLVGAGLRYRRRPETHKRLMLLATVSILAAPIARMHFLPLPSIPPVFFGLTDLFIIASLIHDRMSLGRIHPATAWGGLLVVASQPLRLMLSGTAAWLTVARWLTGLAG